MHSHLHLLTKLALAVTTLVSPALFAQTNGVWINNGSSVWSTGTNWTGGVADGVGASADFSTINISGTRTVTLDSNRTLGSLKFGDATTLDNSYIIAASGGSILTLDNGASAAVIDLLSSSNGDTISATLALDDSLNISNAMTTNRIFTISGAISASSTGTKTIANSGTSSGVTRITGNISDGAGVIAITTANTSTGGMTLSGNNTFTGGVILTSGLLNISSATALGTGTFTITTGTINNNSAAAVALTTNNVQNWNGNFTFTGTNSLDLGTGAVTINANRQVTVTANTLTVGGGIAETGGARTFTKAGAGTLVLNGANTYTGGTTISGGVLRFGTGAGTVSASGNFTINANAALAATGSTGFTSASEWLASGRLVTSSAGALALVADDNTNLSFTNFSGLFLGAIGNVTYGGTITPHSTGGYRLGGGGGTLTVTSNLASTSAANDLSNLTINGNVVLQGSNHYKGTTTITAGLTTFGGLNQFGLNPAITLNGGGVQHAAGNAVDLTIRNITLGTNGGTIDTNGNSIIAEAAIAGTGPLTKSGQGMLTLEVPRSGVGATTVANGSLRLGADNALSTTAALTLGSGSTAGILNLDGHNQTVTTLNISSNSTTAVNRLQITEGNTFTTTGNVVVGVTAVSSTTNLTASGGGTWTTNNTAASGLFQFGGVTAGNGDATNHSGTNADLSGLSQFNVQLTGATSVFRIGDNNATTGGLATNVTLAQNNFIQAKNINIGGSAGNNVAHNLNLGAFSNTFQGDTIEIGAGTGGSARGIATVAFAGGTGTLTVRNQAGAGRAAMQLVTSGTGTASNFTSTLNLAGHSSDLLLSTLTIASRTAGTGSATGTVTFDTGKLDASTVLMAQKLASNTGTITGTLNLNGGDVDLGALTLTANTATGTAGSAVGVLNATRGTVDVATAIIGASTSSNGTASTATINISGDATANFAGLNLARNTAAAPTANSVATGTLNVRNGVLNIGASGLVLASSNVAGGTATGTLNVIGGRLTMAGDISDAGGAGTSNSIINLVGGLLDLGGNDVVNVDTLNWSSGTLQNVASINGGGFVKTTAGLLTLAGNNTWNSATFNSGTTAFTSDANLGGAGAALAFGGGGLRWVTGNTLDLSTLRVITFNSGDGRFDTNGNNITLANAVGNNGAGGLIKSGTGTLTLKASNTYQGNTTFRGGNTVLDYTGSNTGATRTAAASGLVANGGTLEVLGTEVAGQTTTHTAAGTGISPGASRIIATSQGGNNVTLSLGAISRSTGGGTVDFTLPTVGSINTSTANANFAGGSQTILGGYATVNGNTWAVSGSGATAGNISGLTTYNAGFAAGTDVNASATSSVASMIINSLRYTNAGTTTTTLSGALTVATGGILISPGSAAVTINGSTITSGNGQDLIIHQNNTNANTTIGSGIVGNIGVTKSGAGTLVLSGAGSTYTGSLTINGGQVTLGNAAGAGAAAALDPDKIIINGGTLAASTAITLGANFGFQIGDAGATLQHAAGARFTLSGVISDIAGQAGSLNIVGAGPGTGDLVIDGANTYSGGTTITSGLVVVNANSVLTNGVVSSGTFGTGVVTLAGGSLRSGNGADRTVANSIVLAANTTIVDASTAKVLTFSGNVTLAGGNHTLTTLSTADTVFSGNIGEDGTSRGLIKAGTGRLTLSGVNTFTGGITLNGGVLQINSDAALGALPTIATNSLTFADGTVLRAIATSVVTAATRNFTITSGAATLDGNGGNLTVLGQIGGAGTVKTGAGGSVTLANNSNSYQGGTELAGGTLIVSSDGALGEATGDLTFSVNSVLQGLSDLTLNSNRSLIMTSSGVIGTLNPNGSTMTVNGLITGAGGLAIASSSGTVVLAGANDYSGVTVIGGATVGSAVLRITNANALAGTSNVFIGSAGGEDSSQLELALTGTNTISAPINTTPRTNSIAHIQNVSGNNTLTGAFTSNGSGQTIFQSDADLLTLDFASAINTANTIALQGDGNGVVNKNLYSAGSTGGLVKNDAGTWAINAAQTYTGPTTVNRGTFLTNSLTSATGSGAVTISGGTLGGVGLVGGSAMVNGTGAVRPGDPTINAGIGKLTFGAALELSGGIADTDRLILQAAASGVADFNDALGITNAVNLGTLSSYLVSQASFYESQDSGAHDRISVVGTLTAEENAVIRFGRTDALSAYTFSPVVGDVFDLMDFAFFTADGFTYGTNQRSGGLIGDLDLPTLSAGLLYDLTLFNSHGIVVVVGAVPEPARALLLLAGLFAFAQRRRRA